MRSLYATFTVSADTNFWYFAYFSKACGRELS